jgi:hypothetical protein
MQAHQKKIADGLFDVVTNNLLYGLQFIHHASFDEQITEIPMHEVVVTHRYADLSLHIQTRGPAPPRQLVLIDVLPQESTDLVVNIKRQPHHLLINPMKLRLTRRIQLNIALNWHAALQKTESK